MKRLLTIVMAALAVTATAQERGGVLLVGLNDYPLDVKYKSLFYAENDAAKIKGYWKGPSPDVKSLTEGGAGIFGLQAQLIEVLRGLATPRHTVILFFSLRGIRFNWMPKIDGGYLGGFQTIRDKPPGTAVSVALLRDLLVKSNARRIIIFADLCRFPAEDGNEIHAAIRQLGDLPRVSGILASTPGEFSKEDPEKKLGVFAYSLWEALRESGQGPAPTLKELHTRVLRETPAAWKATQRPELFGRKEAFSEPLWRASAMAPEWRRVEVLLASLAMPRLGLAFQGRPAPSTVSDLDRAAALADEAQIVISRYGMSDYLPEDPLRQDTQTYEKAAVQFEQAGKLLPAEVAFDGMRQRIKAREYFCKAMAKPGAQEARSLLEEAHRAESLPEIDNALGIYYLETGKNYTIASEHFRDAIQKAPAWVYPRHNLALALIERGDMGRAEIELRRAMARSPEQAFLYYNLGLLLHRTNRRKEALEVYTQAGQKYEDAASLLEKRYPEWGADFENQRDLAKQRVKVFRRAKGEVKNAIGALLEDGPDEKIDRRLVLAAKSYHEAVEIDVWHCVARSNEARVRERMGTEAELKTARKLWRKNLAKDAKCNEADQRAARLSLARSLETVSPADARMLYEEVRRERESIQALKGLARLAEGKESAIQWERAIAEEEKLAPWAEPALYLELARARKAAGELPAAQAACERADAAVKAAHEGKEWKARLKACPSN